MPGNCSKEEAKGGDTNNNTNNRNNNNNKNRLVCTAHKSGEKKEMLHKVIKISKEDVNLFFNLQEALKY